MSKEITITGNMKIYSYGLDRGTSIEEIRFSHSEQDGAPKAEGDLPSSLKPYAGKEVHIPHILADMPDVEPGHEERGDGSIESYGRTRVTIEFLDY